MSPRLRACATLLLGVGLVAGCDDEPSTVAPEGLEVALAAGSAGGPQVESAIPTAIEAAITRTLPRVERLARARGVEVAPVLAHWLGNAGDATVGGTLVVFQDRGNKRIEIDKNTGVEWVPGDPRRGGRTNIQYAVSPVSAPPVSAAATEAAIDRAMATWNATTRCSDLLIEKTSIPLADIWHAAFVPLGPGVLAVTILFGFPDGSGGFTDLDGDRNIDYAFALILYSSDFSWAIDGNIDVETVALHEAGHGLSQDHFGKGFITLANGRVHLAPRAVMNAAYTGVQQSLTGTDLAGHCGLWGSWPNG